MRDAETIGLALTAAETGHLVLASLHSRTSASAIERIVDAYPPERQRQIRVQLADALRAVIAQRLLPRADGGGRVPAVEFLRVTFAVANLIREGKTPQIPTAVVSGGDDGMMPLERSLAELVRAGIVSLDAARALASDPEGIRRPSRPSDGTAASLATGSAGDETTSSRRTPSVTRCRSGAARLPAVSPAPSPRSAGRWRRGSRSRTPA